MKVLQINSVCGYGSTGRIAVEIYKSLELHGHDCLIAYGRGTASPEINSLRIKSDLSVKTHGVMSRITDKHGFYSTKSTNLLIAKIIEYDPDIVQLHNIHGYYINIESLFTFLKNAHIPVVWTLHDCWAFTGHCAYFTLVKCDLWQTGCQKCPQRRSYPKSLLMDNSKRNFKRKMELFTGIENMTIVTPSQWLAELTRLSFLSEYNITVINNGIDINIFKPQNDNKFRSDRGLEENFIILGVANVWDTRKGLKYFLELSKLIDNSSKIVLVGLNDKQLKHLPKNVIGLGRTNNLKELAEIYAAADVFVNPTLEDNFPTTNLEALACGTPVISFNTGGSGECLNNNTGYEVEHGNVSELFEKILIIKENGKAMYSLFCVNDANILYNRVNQFSQYIDCYNNIVQNGR